MAVIRAFLTALVVLVMATPAGAAPEGQITGAVHIPLVEPACLNGHGPRMAESGLGLITKYSSSGPYEDPTLKAR